MKDKKLTTYCVENEIKQAILQLVTYSFSELCKSAPPEPWIIVALRKRNDNEIEILVKDNGPGLEEETKKALFEPFFTANDPFHTSGIGLAAVYFIIVNDHHGSIEVLSTPGEGTEFFIRLPVNLKVKST